MLKTAAKRTFFVGILSVLLIPAGQAGIIQDSGGTQTFWPFGESVVGQTFTADATVANLSTIEFYYGAANESIRDAASPVISLFAGSGYGGTLLDSVMLTLAENEPSGYKPADFSGNVLIPGQIYTFRITQTAWAEGGFEYSSNDVYPGGVIVEGLQGDLRFRITGSTSAVPEPGTLWLIGLLAPALLLSRRRRV
jgi:hypothetical protein